MSSGASIPSCSGPCSIATSRPFGPPWSGTGGRQPRRADDLVAVFGVPAVHEDDALRAVRAAIDMRQAIADLNDELVAERGVFLQTRTGIDTGEVLVTEDPVPTGRPVATSRRLASDARAGQIVLGERTRGLVRAAVETEELDGSRDVFRVVALVPGADGRTLRLDAPLVGRARPLQALVTAFDSAVDGRSCHLFTVLGAAGVGKSRLVRELAESLGDAARVLRGRCLPYGEGITYLPLLEALPERRRLRSRADRSRRAPAPAGPAPCWRSLRATGRWC